MKKIFFLLSLIIISACNQNSSNNNHMLFNIDTNLLGKTYFDTNLNITFKAPKSFNMLNINNIDSNKTEGLSYYFVDKFDNKFALMIYDIRKLEKNKMDIILNSPFKYLNNNNYWDTIVSDTFSYNTFKVHQLMFQNKHLIAFNLYYSINNSYNFYTVYSLDVDQYQFRIKEIESSIGSFKKIN